MAGAITLLHLLTHTSGLRIDTIFYPFEENPAEPSSLRKAVERFGAEGPKEKEPGWHQSRAGVPGTGDAGVPSVQVLTGLIVMAILAS
jgi:CubicO group peptidase (beta-lactamase class C family)